MISEQRNRPASVRGNGGPRAHNLRDDAHRFRSARIRGETQEKSAGGRVIPHSPWFNPLAYITGTVRRFQAVALSAALALMATAAGSATTLAAESGPPADNPYQLRIDQAPALRLTASKPSLPLTEARKEHVLPPQFANRRFARLIDHAAREAALDPALVHAIIHIESGYNPEALSAKGAVGLMQVLPSTASLHGVPDPASSPAANLRAGTRYLRYLMDIFDSRIDLVLAAYNAGEHAVMRHGLRIPPFRETQRYVPAVLAKYREWQEPEPTVAPAIRRIQYLPGTVLDCPISGRATPDLCLRRIFLPDLCMRGAC